jgi:CRP-like cAMP-binding protein
VEKVLDRFERAPAPASAEPPAPPPAYDRDPPVAESWPIRRLVGALDTAMMGRLPLFQRLTDTELERISGLAGERTVAAGEVIVEQWDGTREFYVVLEGSAAVRTAERHLDDIGPGDFFGEIAALDWGASFGYARLATVTATSPTRLLVLTNADLLVLMEELPQMGARISRAAHDRLPGL